MATLERSVSVTPRGVGGQDYSRATQVFAAEPTVLLREPFEVIKDPYPSSGSAGYSVARTTIHRWKGDGALELQTGNALVTNWAIYNRSFGIVRSLKILVDLMFSLPTINGEQIGFHLLRFTGAQRVSLAVRYSIVLARWQYLDSTGTWQNIPGGAMTLNQNPDIFHHVFLAVDFGLIEYLYMQCNENRIYLTGIAGRTQVDLVTNAYLQTFVNAETTAMSISHYIDNLRVSELI